VPDYPHRASGLLVFPDVESCCRAVTVLKSAPVSAVELLDRRSLRSVENKAGLPAWVKSLSDTACALLIESTAASNSLLLQQLDHIRSVMQAFELEQQVDFSTDPGVYNQLWAIRKGTFPAVGAVRKIGTTVIIEDVTFPLEQLAEGVSRLQQLFDKYYYTKPLSLAMRWKVTCTLSLPRALMMPLRLPATRLLCRKLPTWWLANLAAR
jgi:D-lactate dehydrogenase